MIIPHNDGTLLRLYVQPGASKSCWDSVHGERIKVRIKAPPVDGAANKELISFLSKSFSINKSRVRILRGESSRNKDVIIDLDFEDALRITKLFIE